MGALVRFLATWFYLGLMPKGPGTWGTLGAIPVVWALALAGELGYLAGAVIISALGILVSTLYLNSSRQEDPSEIVIDEVAGFCVAMALLPLTWQAFLAAFVLFRALDILKPWPVGWVDQKIKGGVGVVADDLVAGVLTNLILQFVFVQTPWLGYQLPT